MSGVGKSLLVTAFCRIFMQDGFCAAPFKAQNMSNNSYVTADGREIGRAQAVQAQAAATAEMVQMNPILLKPTGERCSQVMVMGESHGLMDAAAYQEYKKNLLPTVLKAYGTLDRMYDIVVIEGAGGCAEINLRDNDIVNMGLAAELKAPVILAGDIDRGGVFAQLLGTLEWLTAKDRELVKGLIINKFRGDISILKPGVRMLEDRCGLPVLGVVPYTQADIEDEDSMSERLSSKRGVFCGRGNGDPHILEFAVIRLPMISNFTDFNVFDNLVDVNISYVNKPDRLEGADVIFLPGSKNTVADMKWLRENGFAEALKEKAASGVVIFGICGGFQMLGESITDEGGLEGGGSTEGLSLLPVKTVFGGEKITRRVKGTFGSLTGGLASLSGKGFGGYEIHIGKSTVEGSALTSLTLPGGEAASDGSFDQNVYGTYVHGIFDDIAAEFAGAVRSWKKEGSTEGAGSFLADEYKNRQFDILAEAIRSSVDMGRIYDLMI